MKRIVFWTILVALTGSAGIADTALEQPFIRVSTTPDEVNLGTANFFEGVHEVSDALTVKVESNCLHGSIFLSTTPLERRGGGFIKPEDIFVRVHSKGDFVSLKKPVVIMRTSAGSQEAVLDFKVNASPGDLSGYYEGMITLTIMPPV